MIRRTAAHLLAVLALTATAACGNGSSTRLASPSEHYLAGWLPSGFALVTASDATPPADGHSATYGLAGDHVPEALTVSSAPAAMVARLGLGAGSPTTIRGHHGNLVVLTDEGHTYGHTLWWEERPGFVIAVEGRDPIDVATLTHVAQDVRPVDATTWHRLTVETDPAARTGHVVPDMTRHQVLTGTVGTDRWTLTALVPAGYPLGRQDVRMACAELALRAEHSDGNSSVCVGPNWQTVGGVIFVFGVVDEAVRRVHITSAGLDTTINTVATPSFARGRFYAIEAPDTACEVRVANPDANSEATRFGHGLGTIGPLPGQQPEHGRCFGGLGLVPPTTVPRAPSQP